MRPGPNTMGAASLAARNAGETENALTARLASFAVDALVEEANLTPKPALVDRRGSGAHRDLDLARMMRSAHALAPTFAALAQASRTRRPSALLRTDLAAIGRAGEADMMAATGGSNTHRGAIWIVGLLVAGATISHDALGTSDPQAVCGFGAQIACFPDYAATASDSNGSRVCERYGIGGARREAQEGFPHVLHAGLPALVAARRRGYGENAARIDALLAIMTTLDDTCLLHRAGMPALVAAKRGARAVLDAGGSASLPGRAALYRLERELTAMNASPGGAADLLAATLFIDKLVRYGTGGRRTAWNI
ncbi:triphosphoribosyl-dephospho-CoA synthase [Trinickia caryophylli]|uniref:Probable 2-(5''-triphosphoribosyl)-3'-dephosphocoenzyme-A synthase n=1 Tax=Trinickia caryophylli TaxID=28094 RepID=A0A1X7CVV7_TRICW|nr:putative 2-(5''-triphosphoribosyl)-3'-dephosphocoenzyme-A synthase [Trinickia caryophylli]SMF04117.1 triphosphoribosyl-dephospho-CoA synthase [Trinickia caryophylli]